MRQYITLLFLLWGALGFSQLEVSIGYLTPTTDDKGYGKAYLAVGHKFGGAIVIGGDSRITYAQEKEGRGWVGGHLWYDIQHQERDRSFKLFAGLQGAEAWERIDALADPLSSGFYQPKRLTNVEIKPYAGIALGWKFLELTFTSDLEIGLGVKLNR